uniref:Uncharacterized protein n=1 Tax=Tetranychus urticae TaxID=32264 RepID=T1KUP0_TETUR
MTIETSDSEDIKFCEPAFFKINLLQ